MLFYAATIISLSAALWFVQPSLSYAQRETVVATSSQLISALADADVSTITVQQDIKLSAAGKLRVYIDRNLTISGPGWPLQPVGTIQNHLQNKSAAGPRPAAVVLDFAHQPEVVILGPDVVLVLQNLQLENAAVIWGPNLCFIEHSARSRIRLVNVVWPNPLCPPSLKWLHEQILVHTPIPANYEPPPELIHSILPGPFKVVVIPWSRQECEEQWWSPSTCQAENTFVRQSVVEVPSTQDNRLNFNYNESTMALYEYFNMSVPCTGWVDVGCMESKGYLTCHNELMGNIMWKNQLRDRKWHICAGVLAALAATWLSTMWLLQQRQQQRKLQEQGRQLQSAEAILAREGDHPTSPGTAATADSAGISAGDEATSITGVQSKEGVLNNVKLGALVGAGSFGRVYAGTWNGMTVAVKVMDIRANKHMRLVRHELDINMMLQHPNVVRCLDYHVSGQGPQAAGRTATAAQSSADAALHMQSGQSPHCDGNCGILGPVTGAATSDPCTLHHEGLPHGYVATGSLSSPYALPGSPSASWSEDHNATGPMQQVLMLLEYCDGGSLNAAIRSGLLRRHISSFSSFNNMVCVLRIALDVARGMQHLHRNNVCHGDLNSNNVLLSISPDVPAPLGVVAKVADFGLSRLMPEQGTHLSTLSCGTITHAAPEVLLTGQLRLRSDVYSFGILLWELVHLGTPLSAASSSGLSWPSSTSQSSLLVVDPLAWPGEGQDEAGRQNSFTASAGAEEEMQQPGSTSDVSATQAKRSKAVISSAYQELRAMPWIIANKVIEGMRPVFVAPAVPGPYIQLAKRCWDVDPVKRPSFDEVVELLESVVHGDHLVATTPKDSDLSPSQHIGSF